MKRKASYYNLFEQSPLPMWVYDVNTYYFLDVNIAATVLYGFSKEEFLTMTIAGIVPAEDLEIAKNIVRENAKTGESYKNTFRHVKKNGELIYVEVESSQIELDDKQARVVLVHDITRRLADQKEVMESMERYNIVSQATSDVIWDYTIRTGQLSWNKGIEEILKYRGIGSITNIDWWKNNIHPEDRERVVIKFDRHLEEGLKRWEAQYRFLCGDGNYKHILDKGYIGLDDKGCAYRMIGAMQDVTKVVEEEHWSKLLESVVINTTDGVVITDTAESGAVIIYVNDALLSMSGFSREELIGKAPDVFHGYNHAQQGLRKIDIAIKNGLSCNVELINYTKNGKPYDVSINICPVTDNTGTITHWVSIQRDITENRNYVKEIEDQNKKLVDIAWMHSHKVRGPLTQIMALVELLKDHSSIEDQSLLHEYLSKSALELDHAISDITKNTEHGAFTMNEKRFYAFMDELPGLCWIADDDNFLRYANKCFFDTLHLSPEIIGKPLEEIFGEEIAKSAQLNNKDVLKSGENKEFHQTVRDRNGHPQYYKTYKFPFKDGEGGMVGAVAFNVTKRIKLEEELYQSEAQFKQAFEHSLVGMALISPQGKWERVNRSLCQMLGYTEHEMKALSIQDLTHPDDLKGSQTILEDLALGKIEEVKYEKRYLHKDGSAIWVIIAATMLYDSAGKALHYVSQIEDITKRKEIENDLVLSEKKYRTIFENVQDVFYQTNQEGIVTEISPSISHHSGYLRTEIIGKPVGDFYYYLQDRERIIEQLRINGAVIDFEVRLKTKDEELRYASVNAKLNVENGVITGTEGSMRDVTRRKFQENALQALNTELTASNEQKNKLFSIIGHDLRNPISGSLQLLDLTLNDFESSSADEVHLYLSMMKTELSNANILLEDLLTWAKSQFNAVSFNPVEIEDLAGLIDKCIQTVSPMAIKKNINIVPCFKGDILLHADIGMLETIIRNLLSNAVKFTGAGGSIGLKAVGNDNGVLFSIKDNGLGIPTHKINELFNKNSSYTTFGTSGEKGTGLGLSLCNDFVLKHGGALWVESEEGVGTTFYFTIPELLKES
ncbi:PAS domain S-box protein [Pedobacter hiemivivus]|uniref:histidine kinase n=1 Tax=Pedobacter hiemivivus TaxID=2530454 RepID=A0A4U1GQ37_9SPHI|nr:PAS domain S-box protein [Pedobacter hiemivivus]TKC63892.1 PAS domain S-box protein [Pedobacter hiemivivus]